MATPSLRADASTLVEVTDLHVEFPTREGVVHAVRGVSFAIREGETLGIVGESGSGKSVSSQAMLRILPRPGRISRGSIRWHQRLPDGAVRATEITELGDRSSQMNALRRREMSLIMQEPMSALSPVHTIGNQIVERLRLGGSMTRAEARLKAIDLMRSVGIPNPEKRIDAYTFELSGGMRQRAMIAMAIGNAPRLLIADEPTTAVDVTIQAQVIRLLQSLQDSLRMSILIITHDLGVVATLAHRIAVMYRGEIVELGPVRDILKDPRHPYTQGLLRSVASLETSDEDSVATIPGVVPHPFEVVPGCPFHPRCSAFMPGVCDRVAPERTRLAPDREVRCHIYQSRA